MKQFALLLCILLALTCSLEAKKQKQIQFEVAFGNIDNVFYPVDMDYYNNDVYVTTLGGQVLKFPNNDAATADQVETFFDLYSASVPFFTNWFNGGDDGLTSIEFHPQYPVVPKFYSFYSSTETSIQITAWTVVNGVVDYASADVLLTIPKNAPKSVVQPNSIIYEAYLGGDLRFLQEKVAFCDSTSDSNEDDDDDQDKRRSSSFSYNLYISVGDGNDPTAAQDFNNLLGKVLRITPNRNSNGYSVPCTNPFVGATGADEIYARGLRNPRKIAFSQDDDDDEFGNLFIGDVGAAYDEIDRQTNPGKNFGWPLYDGCSPASSQYTSPIYAYTSEEPHTITLGPYYPSNGPIKSLRGRLLFADLYSGNLFSIQTSDTRSCATTPTLAANAPIAISAFTLADNVVLVANVFGAFYGAPNFYRVVEV